MTIYIASIHYSVTNDDLKKLFGQYGEVLSAKLALERETGRSRGFGFIEMEDDEAKEAIEKLNGFSYKGRTLQVNEAKPKVFKKD